LISNSKSRDVLAYDGKKLITEINISSVITDPKLSYRTRTTLEDLLYRSVKHGAGKEVVDCINKLNKIATGNDRRAQNRAKSVLYRLSSKFAYPDLRTATPKEVKTFCGPLLELIKNQDMNRRCAAAAAFLNYLNGNEKAFLAVTKKTPLDKNFNYFHVTKQILTWFEKYSGKNKISTADTEKVISGFLNSESAKKLFNEKKAELEKLKKYMRKRFEKKRKTVKLNKTPKVKLNVKKKTE
jgi:hypothetical protein